LKLNNGGLKIIEKNRWHWSLKKINQGRISAPQYLVNIMSIEYFKKGQQKEIDIAILHYL